MEKKSIPAAVEAPATGGQLAVTGFTPEAYIENLKILNKMLVKETVEHRQQIHKLHSELGSLAADHDILDATQRDVFRFFLSSSLSDAAARSSAEMAAATEFAGKTLKMAELATAELNAAELRLLAVAREKDRIERDLEGVVEERDLSRNVLKEREAVDAKCGKLEEELQSVMYEKNLLIRCREDDKHLVEKLVTDMEEMRSQLDVDKDILKAENKANALKISALEETCYSLKEIRGQLENKVEELNEEKMELIATNARVKESYVEVEEDLQRNLNELGPLVKEKLKIQKTFDLMQKEMTLQINESKENMAKMAAEKNLADQRNADYEIQISSLQAEISELQSARKSLEDAHRSSIEDVGSWEAFCAAVSREKNLKAEEAETLRMQLNESMKTNHTMEQKLEELQKKLNHQTAGNEETKKHINSLMVEKASLEKQLETSNQGLKDIEKQLKTLDDASGQVFTLLKRITAEVMDKETTHENCIDRETGVEVENDKEMKLFVDKLEAIKLAMKDKDTKINNLKQELEVLQLSVACSKNKGRIWKWLFPATTTIFVAVSVAYAARTR